MKLGIDIGRVIIAGDGPDTNFMGKSIELAMKTPAITDSFRIIKKLVSDIKPENVFLVSKCGDRIRERTRAWLDHHDFWNETGVLKDNIHFCYKRYDKAPICKELGITHFIDDRVDCLLPMAGIVEYRFLFGPQRHECTDNNIIKVNDWSVVWKNVLATCMSAPHKNCSK